VIKLEYFLVVIFVLALFGCGEKPPPRDVQLEKPKAEKPIDSSPVDKAKIAANAAIEKVFLVKSNGGSEVDQLKAEKDALVKQRDLAHAERDAATAKASDLDKSIKDKDDQIAESRDRAIQERIYWFAGILGFVALVGGVVAFAFPLARSWAGGISIACGVMAGVAVFAAWLVPYMWWVGAVVVVSAVIGTFLAWRTDSKIGNRLVETVERVKNDIPNYKDRLRAEVGDIDTMLDKRREQLGLKRKS